MTGDLGTATAFIQFIVCVASIDGDDQLRRDEQFAAWRFSNQVDVRPQSAKRLPPLSGRTSGCAHQIDFMRRRPG
jgi:hypothetical protein